MQTHKKQARQVALSQRKRKVAQLAGLYPTTPDQLHQFVTQALHVNVPRKALVIGNDAPFDYLVHCFFEKPAEAKQDIVVWASRGSGKTLLGAVATLLDMIFKPGIQIRILGGSLDQSGRMYEFLRQFAQLPKMRDMVIDKSTLRSLTLCHGSSVEVLTQSHSSVRGSHVHKLRCDEVELFKPDIWQAAQLIVQSGQCGPTYVRGAVDALSTMHLHAGLMKQLTRGNPNRRVMRWCSLDVLERCPPARDCQTCPLWVDCLGRAKQASGFLPIDDLIAHRSRVSQVTWDSEVMCKVPRRDHLVYPNFAEKSHVAEVSGRCELGDIIIGGMDFGLRSQQVVLWAVLRGQGKQVIDQQVHVFAEHVVTDTTLEKQLKEIDALKLVRPIWLGVDPAGAQRNRQTGLTDVQVLRQFGYHVRYQHGMIRDGIERLRRRLDQKMLVIDPSCAALIQAMQSYHFDPQHLDNINPIKDGPDHACDALRYMVDNLEAASAIRTRVYA